MNQKKNLTPPITNPTKTPIYKTEQQYDSAADSWIPSLRRQSEQCLPFSHWRAASPNTLIQT